ncbi:hypothetical protein Pla108_35480 [Botrimarina colliarenosi]|uniref:Uncharacterized protein n=1 Tax=Botrimarina colliarenosi TaxID=2528001 RepID=A0A5C6A7N3_9BACT|nr:hypothetical protein Pla108_35480 [Botrimarina colliarenosi]
MWGQGDAPRPTPCVTLKDKPMIFVGWRRGLIGMGFCF